MWYLQSAAEISNEEQIFFITSFNSSPLRVITPLSPDRMPRRLNSSVRLLLICAVINAGNAVLAEEILVTIDYQKLYILFQPGKEKYHHSDKHCLMINRGEDCCLT